MLKKEVLEFRRWLSLRVLAAPAEDWSLILRLYVRSLIITCDSIPTGPDDLSGLQGHWHA